MEILEISGITGKAQVAPERLLESLANVTKLVGTLLDMAIVEGRRVILALASEMLESLRPAWLSDVAIRARSATKMAGEIIEADDDGNN